MVVAKILPSNRLNEVKFEIRCYARAHDNKQKQGLKKRQYKAAGRSANGGEENGATHNYYARPVEVTLQ